MPDVTDTEASARAGRGAVQRRDAGRSARLGAASSAQPQPKTASGARYVFFSPEVDALDGLPGCVVVEHKRCGKLGCRCAEPQGRLHGPYFYHYYRDAFGRAHKRYLARTDAPRVAALCDQYRARRLSRRELRRLVRDFARLSDALAGWLGGVTP